MRRGHRSTYKPEGSVVDAALEAMDAEALRELIRGVLPWLDDKLHAKVTGEIIDRAARSKHEWTPDAPNDESVTEVLEFAEAAQRVGYADPSEVDDYLRQGMNAFLAKDYRAAFQIFGALIVPLSEGEIDLGQHEMLDEVLGVDVADCAAQYVVAMYMTAASAHRAKAVKTAIDDMSAAGHFWHPIEQLERVTVEPLPDFENFLDKVEDSSARAAMLKAMQKAAEKRLDGVTENKRRRYYGHAASLAAACMAVDETSNSSKWFAAIRDEYRRYPALQRELNRYGGGQ